MSEMQKVSGVFKSNFNYYQRVAHKKLSPDHIREKIIFDSLRQKLSKIFFFKYDPITHQSLDLVELSRNMWFLRFF
jgi:hypothetical protein